MQSKAMQKWACRATLCQMHSFCSAIRIAFAMLVCCTRRRCLLYSTQYNICSRNTVMYSNLAFPTCRNPFLIVLSCRIIRNKIGLAIVEVMEPVSTQEVVSIMQQYRAIVHGTHSSACYHCVVTAAEHHHPLLCCQGQQALNQS